MRPDKLLQKKQHLTISYDGGSTCAVKSIYSVHVTTPETRESYFIKGNEASGLSHTGEHIQDLLLKVCLLFFPSASILFDCFGMLRLSIKSVAQIFQESARKHEAGT